MFQKQWYHICVAVLHAYFLKYYLINKFNVFMINCKRFIDRKKKSILETKLEWVVLLLSCISQSLWYMYWETYLINHWYRHCNFKPSCRHIDASLRDLSNLWYHFKEIIKCYHVMIFYFYYFITILSQNIIYKGSLWMN